MPLDQGRCQHLLLLQQCAAVWGHRAIGKRQIEAQLTHLGDQPDGGFLFSRRIAGPLSATSKSAPEMAGLL